VLAAALTCACGAHGRSATSSLVAQGVTAGPYVLLGAPGTAYVVFLAEGLADAPLVEWSVPSGAAGGERAIRSDDVWYAELIGLPVGELVSYRIRTARGVGQRRAFRVGPRAGESFRFGVYGQTQKGRSVHERIAVALEREHIDFVIHTGDMVHESDLREQWLEFFSIERSLLATTPILVAAGDRDAGTLELFRRYFLHRVWNENRRYYSLDWGNLRIVVMDVNNDFERGSRQYSVVEAALMEGARAGKLMVLVVHYPPYSSAAQGWHDVRAPIHALAREFGVELVLAGHALNYERIEPQDGVTYVVSGGAGARPRQINPARFSAAVSTAPHYILIDVEGEGERMTLRTVTVAGDTVDDYVVRALAPSSAAAAVPGN